ncbi:hypothetical protein [Mucilaginibacter flavus]|uniref:hypothetical protein n=1 Tax=Mucilaginibacter flavus TaxID=931504 RepID=UPI0025B3F220|nr:hypothetical protein [Mucilaginibacter flavus]MDN3579909.1 hypothetical protein [Mucilaginibacter flavus]
MRSLREKKIVFTIVCIILSLASIDVLLTPHVSRKNISFKKATFRTIREIQYKGDISYELYINESADYIKIAADDYKCFDYNVFQSRVNNGDTIELGIKTDFLTKDAIVSLTARQINYIDADCINSQIDHNKEVFPLATGLVIVVGLLYLRYKKEHGE